MNLACSHSKSCFDGSLLFGWRVLVPLQGVLQYRDGL